jgi:hypothetical protein
MLPFVAAAVGAWTLPASWLAVAVRLAIIWGALILALVAGVRRGYGFGSPEASTSVAIRTMLVYFVPAGVALIFAGVGIDTAALGVLAIGFSLVMVLDPRAAKKGDAPSHFAALRGVQMAMAVMSLLVLIVWLLV